MLKKYTYHTVFLSVLFFMTLQGDTVAMQGSQLRMSDFSIYYAAGNGDFDYHVPRRPDLKWYYADWTAVFWNWCRLFDYSTAASIWRVLQFLACWYIGYKLLEVQYGWIIGLGLLKSYSWVLVGGNVAPILAAILVSPLGILLAGLVKPWLLGFGGLMAGRQYLESRSFGVHTSRGHSLPEHPGILAATQKRSRRLILLAVVVMSIVIYNTVVLFKWQVHSALTQ